MKERCRHKVDHGYVKVSITDMGIGIAVEYLDSIFERFKQVEQSPTAKK